MEFYPGFEIEVNDQTMDFSYGKGVFGPTSEKRYLDDIRASLSNPNAEGPNILYSIVMDTGCLKDKEAMLKRNLLYGVVTYSEGCIGEEPVRSQGHIHAISASCNSSTCEVYEIFDGEAYIYMQESGEDEAGQCYAVHAKAGEVVIVPPGWVHATVNANINKNMTFGAWCVRDYEFDYDLVKKHKGIAFFPKVKNNEIIWELNPQYQSGTLKVMNAIRYENLQLETGKPIYTQFQEEPDRFLFVSQPDKAKKVWDTFNDIMSKGDSNEI